MALRPAETAGYLSAFDADLSDPGLAQRLRLLNPMFFIGDPKAKTAKHFRIRVGACDADTSFSVSLSLALLLRQAGCTADYALVWDQPHCDADYPGECENWIEDICQ